MYTDSDRILEAINSFSTREEKLKAAHRAYKWYVEMLRKEQDIDERGHLRIMVAWLVGLRLGMMM